ncbi:MAG: hypothetical protein H0U49_01765 [Parachlamydiaceae bacterium]|nr:hypothetical protein [Parachlamydiaceae bacterium]
MKIENNSYNLPHGAVSTPSVSIEIEGHKYTKIGESYKALGLKNTAAKIIEILFRGIIALTIIPLAFESFRNKFATLAEEIASGNEKTIYCHPVLTEDSKENFCTTLINKVKSSTKNLTPFNSATFVINTNSSFLSKANTKNGPALHQFIIKDTLNGELDNKKIVAGLEEAIKSIPTEKHVKDYGWTILFQGKNKSYQGIEGASDCDSRSIAKGSEALRVFMDRSKNMGFEKQTIKDGFPSIDSTKTILI